VAVIYNDKLLIKHSTLYELIQIA